MIKKTVIGIDQSYSDTGVAICHNGDIVAVTDIETKGENRILKRDEIFRRLNHIIGLTKDRAMDQGNDLEIIIERIRMVSSKPGRGQFLDYKYIKNMGALNGLIIDIAYRFGVPVYSVDTRSWKSRVVGTTKPTDKDSGRYGVPPEKWNTIEFCLKNGYRKYIYKEVGERTKKCFVRDGKRYTYNDNIADAICISLYGFLEDAKLELED